MDDMYAILDTLDEIKLPATIATIVQVEGSAYKKEAACMLLQQNGEQIGVLSAGCLEQDLIERVKNGETNKKVVFDMSAEDDFSFGAEAGCNGVIHVLMERVDERYLTHLHRLNQLLKMGYSILVVKRISQATYLFVPDKGEPFGTCTSFTETEIERLKMTCDDQDKKSGTIYMRRNDPLYVHVLKPKPRLVVFGAGTDAIPLVSMAADVGFKVNVSDWRPGLCTGARFPKADRIIHGFPHEAVEAMSIHSNDYVVIMTHHFTHDQQLLQLLRGRNLRYVGVLGSTRRTARLVGEEEVPDDVVSPAGLSIHAQGAEEIAVSIVAQMIQVLRSPVTKVSEKHVI
ncbi:XdhC family protein [Alkalicoccobacillus murimartini]|uniref:Xanthine dehydrogenase molybdenum-binding subunit/xanthine dehydrogenase accessory factor n=1 Tax=Alkalicoccobacillus murimartini TaxID=171685 RepID=A0ABT9YFV5_9BACI|nr:XdhC/CoxI family protein [Alkalicoccobacillus murimartini]MDQ0206737.1 xanthine dehydrogenase molybdenum-binding subunit/xanthine dehydrogenase accessory factor [Alkalicoccobacillus murimartini]